MASVLGLTVTILSAPLFAGGSSPPTAGKAAVIAPTVGGTQGAGGTNEGGSQGVQADAFTGAATYAVPIAVPPGRGGLEPRLLLHYNSYRKNPNSWVGLGWELEFGAIVRLPEQGNTDFYNGVNFEFRFGGQAETLVQVKTGIDPALYGIAVAPNVFADEYRLKIESTFNIFLHLRNTNLPDTIFDHGWVVIDKGGRRYLLGSTQTSRDQKFVKNGAEEWVARWFLDAVTDPNGNTLTLTYGEDLLPAAIIYNDIQITFAKTVTDDVHYYPTFKQGFLRREQVARLSDIFIDQIVANLPKRLQRIRFQYTPAVTNAAPWLSSITRYGQTDDVALPPLTFKYVEGGDLTWASPASWAAGVTQGGEVNGGIVNDRTALADVNGDGLVDQVVGFPTSGAMAVRLSDNNGFGAPVAWPDPFDGCAKPTPNTGKFCSGKLTDTFTGEDDHQWLFLMDMNGDTLPDRVARSFKDNNYTSAEAYFVIAFNTGAGWGPSVETWKDPYVGPHPGTLDRDKGLIDMNGDGLVDRIVGDTAMGGFRIYYNTGAGFQKDYLPWKDPLATAVPNHPAIARLREWDVDGPPPAPDLPIAPRLYVDIRDLNGDGMPDRIYRTTIYTNDPAGTPGFHVSLNLNGMEWAMPEVAPEGGCFNHSPCTYFNASDTLGIIDPVTTQAARGYLTDDTHDLIDFNADGYLDRAEGNPTAGTIRVHYYVGLSPSLEVTHYTTTPVTLSDPLTTAASKGYLTRGTNNTLHTFLRDMNGDLYPDRVGIDPTDNAGANAVYQIGLLRVEPITFADSPIIWSNPQVNQPIGALKATNNGQGLRAATEYLPSSWPLGLPGPTHRFLPTPLYVAHKLYTVDPSIPPFDLPEAQRHPQMRWVTIRYWGGNLFVRYAHKASNDVEDDAVDAPYVSRLNGFQRVERIHAPVAGETWPSYTTTQKFHQAMGDVPIGKQPEATIFDETGYTHFALSGKPYASTIAETGVVRRTETMQWEVNAAPAPASYTSIDCVTPSCVTKLTTRTAAQVEAAGGPPRTMQINYVYDAVGNVVQESVFGNGALYRKIVRTYHPATAFLPALQIRNRLASMFVTLDNTVYRRAEYGYDAKGNPTNESYFVNAAGTKQETIARTFNAVGNIVSVTGIDGVTRAFTYDAMQLFPVTETMALPDGTPFTTQREFDRLTGAVRKELNPQGVGAQTLSDDFGRPVEERILSADGGYITARVHDYTYVVTAIDHAAGETLLKTTTREDVPGYPNAFTTPAIVSFIDGRGSVLQQCHRSERWNFRRTQARRHNGGRATAQTEPVFAEACPFLPQLAPNSATLHSTQDLFGRPTLVTPPPGDLQSPTGPVAIAYSNSLAGELTRSITAPNSQQRTEISDGIGRLSRVTAEENAQLQFLYNPSDDLLVTKLNGQVQASTTYDLRGRKTTTTDADMGNWSYAYDTFGRLTQQTDNKQQKTTFTYDGIGRLTTKQYLMGTGAMERAEAYTYDVASDGYDVRPGELFAVAETDATGALLRRSRFAYDPSYRRIATMSRLTPALGEFHQTFIHDYLGKLTATTYPGNAQLHSTYNVVGGLWKVCEEKTCTPTKGEVYQTMDPANAYDAVGALLKESAGNGVATQYEYFPASHRLAARRVRRNDQLYAHRTYTYDAQANLFSLGDPLKVVGGATIGQTTYDDLNRLTSATYGDGAKVTMTYSSDGNLLTNSAAYPDKTYEYLASRPHAVAKIGDEAFSYDANGNMTADAARAMTYNAQNQLIQVTMTNGTVAQYDYDYTGARVTKHVVSKDTYGKPVAATTHYLGEAIEIRIPGGGVDNGADAEGGDQVLLHVHSGGRRIATRTLGTLAQVLGAPAGTLARVDPPLPWGERLRVRESAWHDEILNGLAVTLLLAMLVFCFPGRAGRMRWASHAPPRDLSLRALSVSKGDAIPRAALGHRCIALLLTCLLLTSPIGTPLAGDTGTPPKPYDDTTYLVYHHADHLGSSHLITEGLPKGLHSGITYPRGTVIQRFEYGVWGQERFALNPNLAFDPRYTGQPYDIETGLYYYKARYYNPLLARFIQPDATIPNPEDPQAYNRYSYSNNNPLKYTDPTGRAPHFEMSPEYDNFVYGGERQDDPPFHFDYNWDTGPDGTNLVSSTTHSSSNTHFGAVSEGPTFHLIDPSQFSGGFTTSNGGLEFLDYLQLGLDVIGLAPVVGEPVDLLNAAISALRGNYLDASLSAAAAIPFAGWGATIGKLGRKADRIVEISKTERTVFRQGKFENNSWVGNAVKGKEWSPDHPLSTPDFAKHYGLPAENSGTPDWVTHGRVEGNYSTRPSSPSYNNPDNTGGKVEIVPDDPSRVRLDWFHTP